MIKKKFLSQASVGIVSMCFDNIVDIFVNIEKLIEIFLYHPLSFSPSLLAIFHHFPLFSSFFIVLLVIPCHPLPSFIPYPIVPHHPPINPNVAHCTPLKGIPISIWHMVDKKIILKITKRPSHGAFFTRT